MKDPAPACGDPLPAKSSPVESPRIESSRIEIEHVFHALGDPTRRAIVDMLSQAPRSISTLATALGVTLTAVGQHLQILEECGLARSEKLGRVRTCSLDLAGLDALAQWVRDRKPPIVQSLDLLEKLLLEKDQEDPK